MRRTENHRINTRNRTSITTSLFAGRGAAMGWGTWGIPGGGILLAARIGNNRAHRARVRSGRSLPVLNRQFPGITTRKPTRNPTSAARGPLDSER